MAKLGSYIVNIGEIHLDWGIERAPGREREEGEGYIKIPIAEAKRLEIYNSNKNPHNSDILGINIFKVIFKDGFRNGEYVELKAAGSQKAGDIYAKNFQGNGYGALKLIKDWYNVNNATTSNRVKVEFIAFDTVVLEII